MGTAVSIESVGTKVKLTLMEILPLDTVLSFRILTANRTKPLVQHFSLLLISGLFLFYFFSFLEGVRGFTIFLDYKMNTCSNKNTLKHKEKKTL